MIRGPLTTLATQTLEDSVDKKVNMRLSIASNSCASTASLSSVSSSTSLEDPTTSIKAESNLERYLSPKFGTGSLPSQRDAARWLKYLIYFPLVAMTMAIVSTEFVLRIILRYGMVRLLEGFYLNILNDPLLFRLVCASLVLGLMTAILFTDIYTFVMLWQGKRRRSLPSDPDKRLIHAVVICQYKEPLEVLDATVDSLVDSTLAHNTIVVLACEERDPFADSVFETLESKYGHRFRNFLQTSHRLAPGEVIGKSSNENHAVRELYAFIQNEGVDPFDVMVTVCDADSLFDPVFLEHVEAEFWRMPDGRRAIYNAPINTYRNLSECNFLVQVVEMSRCQDDTFLSPTSYRPSQSNYSLTLGFAHETGYWDPSNTAEDFHTAIKAMAISGQGKNIIIQVWSLVLNDSVCTLKDRWTQAKRHMWGVEECAWTLELFYHLRLKRWLVLMALTFERMILGPNCVPKFPLLFLPSVRQAFFSLQESTQYMLVGFFVVLQLGSWLRVVLREVALRRCILVDRKHMKPAGWVNWLLLATPLYLVIEQISLLFFFTCATWRMLLHARQHSTILYVTAPKAFHTSSADQEASGLLLEDDVDVSAPLISTKARKTV